MGFTEWTGLAYGVGWSLLVFLVSLILARACNRPHTMMSHGWMDAMDGTNGVHNLTYTRFCIRFSCFWSFLMAAWLLGLAVERADDEGKESVAH